MADRNSSATENRSFDTFSSKTRRIYIPLDDFRYFHRPSEVNDVDPYYIGREQISRQLEKWLSDTGQNYTGTYLITGYRGMGKTSFVSKVINQIIEKQHGEYNATRIGTCYAVALALIGCPLLYATTQNRCFCLGLLFAAVAITALWELWVVEKKKDKVWNNIYPILIDISTLLPLYAVFCYMFMPKLNWLLYSLAVLFVVYFMILFLGRTILKKFNMEQPKYILQIKVNIGNEVSETKDVLALFAYSIRNHISAYIHKKSHTFLKYAAIRGLQWSIAALVGVLLFEYALPVLEPAARKLFGSPEKGLFLTALETINEILYQLRIHYALFARWAGMAVACLIGLAVSKFLRLQLDRVIRYAGRSWPKATGIIQELDNLCERIDAAVQDDKGTSLDNIKMSVFNIAFLRRSTKNYRPASIREIEQQLVNIIQEINDSKILNCRMIIILDELDKLSCKQSAETNADIVYPEFTVDENGVSDDISTNEKKHRILSLLGQLKFFITSAKAKFIFIAGHELYDAYLADVSDREYSVSSIFNGVLNVDSFFSCDHQTKDITRLTEYFLCKHLIPRNCSDGQGSGEGKAAASEEKSDTRPDDWYTFSNYAVLLKKELDNPEEKHEEKPTEDQVNKPEEDQIKKPAPTFEEVEAVLVFLRQFVTYLTFTSNGAPKKLITTLEKYVISQDERNSQRKHYKLSAIEFPPITVIKNKNENEDENDSDKKPYYLAFGYYDQQKIGFIHYIANPIFENIISPSSEFGDKLLVASSFLIAHIYKYHNSGFSRRNLEYMPELLDSNRTPELRSFIDSIIGYLGQIHLTSITSGIYVYKFPLRLSEEIAMFSKKSEEISAIFNFSLDDSLAVKKLYYRLLEFYRQKQKESAPITSAFHHNLGDIHLANKEYTEAIAQYRQTAQAIDAILQKIADKGADCAYTGSIASQIMRYTRVMLKLGLAYEKRNSLDSAYTIYSTLTTRLIAFREIDESPFGLTHLIVRTKNDTRSESDPDRRRVLLIKDAGAPKAPFGKECYTPIENDDIKTDYWIYGEELTDNLCDQLSPKKYALISKLSVFEDLRLAYLPILAKLFVLEKYNICGITKDNIKVADAEFRYLFQITNSRDKYLLRVDFYRKLGDILYYKNGPSHKGDPDSIMSMISNWGYDLKSAIFDRCYQQKELKPMTTKIIDLFDQPYDDSTATIDEVKNKLKSRSDFEIHTHIDGIFEDLPDQIKHQWTMIGDCRERRKYARPGREKTAVPCVACNCYARSLSILLFRLTGQHVSENAAYQFLRTCEQDALRTKRYNELTQTALTLSSMGNVLLSCVIDNDGIRGRFITALFKSPERRTASETETLRTPLGHLERAILHYWTAMHYHNLAFNHKEGILCLTWIFNILSGYLAETDLHSETGPFKNACEGMEATVKEALSRIHSLRDYAGLKEASQTKSMLGPFNGWSNFGLNSVMPDAEELLLVYYEVLLSQLSSKADQESFNKYLDTLGYLYKSPALTYMRNESLTYNRVISLLFKAKLNERLLWLLRGKKDNEPPASDAKDLNFDKDGISAILHLLQLPSKNSDKPEDAAPLLIFLISDSLFCLTSIMDFIKPTARTSLFTNSFCLSVHKRLLRWVRWKEWTTTQPLKGNESLQQGLEQEIDKLIDDHNKYMLKQTYLKETINKYYDAARAMHTEGLEYQNYISDMYLLDDDLQNNTCQFYFALERYKIRAGQGRRADRSSGKEYFTPRSYFKYKTNDTDTDMEP